MPCLFISNRGPNSVVTNSSFYFSACFLNFFNLERSISTWCQFVPAIFSIAFVHLTGGLPLGGGLQFITFLVQRSLSFLQYVSSRPYYSS